MTESSPDSTTKWKQVRNAPREPPLIVTQTCRGSRVEVRVGLSQGKVLVEGVRDRFQRAGLVGEGVPWRGGWGVLKEVNAVEFPSSPTFCFTWRRDNRTLGDQWEEQNDSNNRTLRRSFWTRWVVRNGFICGAAVGWPCILPTSNNEHFQSIVKLHGGP